MFSERGNDGIARSEEQWFKRHNPKAPERGGARKSRAAKAGDWLDKTRQAWEQTANRALEQAGRAERIDGRSLPDRRDAAHREGDLERAAELSREPNVHRGPGQYLKDRGRASATVAQAEAVAQRTASRVALRVLSKAACAAGGMTSTGSAHRAARRGRLWFCSRNSMSTKKHDGLGDRHDAKGGRATSPACRWRTRRERPDVCSSGRWCWSPRVARVIATIHGQARRSGSVETPEPPMPRWLEASARPAADLAILTRRIHRPVERSISEDESWRNGTSKLTRTPARNA